MSQPSINLSTAAAALLQRMLAQKTPASPGFKLLVQRPGTPKAEPLLAYYHAERDQDHCQHLKLAGLDFYLDEKSLPYLVDLELDVQSSAQGQQLTLKAPHAKKRPGSGPSWVETQEPCPAIRVPSGQSIVLAAGQRLKVTQSLGGSYSLIYQDNLVRVDGKHAHLLGLSAQALQFSPRADRQIDSDQLWQALATVFDPEIPVDIVNLGLVYQLAVDQAMGQVRVRMTLTAPGCGMGDVLVEEVKIRLLQVPFVEKAQVELVFEPTWERSMMSEEAQLATGLFF